LAKRYKPEDEEFGRDDISGEELQRLHDNLKNLDSNLGSYPYADWKKWISLTNKISLQTIARCRQRPPPYQMHIFYSAPKAIVGP
jgi:A1 cistron-splicing factor AAR2